MTGKQDEKGSLLSKQDEKKKRLLDQLNIVKRVKQQQNSKDVLKNKTIKVQDRLKIKEQTIKVLNCGSNNSINQPNRSQMIKNQTKLSISDFTSIIGLETQQKNNKIETNVLLKNQIENSAKNKQVEKLQFISPVEQKQNMMKRPINKLIFTEQLQNQIKQLQKQSQKKKNDFSPQKYNESTCIQISSSQSEQTVKRSKIVITRNGSKTQCKQRKEKQKDLQLKKNQNIINQNHNIEQFGLTNMLFSKVKLTYVHLNSEIIGKLRKQKKRPGQNNLIGKANDFKVNLQSTFVSIAQTAPISIIIQKIKIQEKIPNDSKNYRFFFFKGTQKDLRQTISNSLLKDENTIKSQKFINLKRLYEWYTLAHLLSSSSNVVIVIEKNMSYPVIEDFYYFKCQCKNSCLEICLCLQFWVCRRKDPCSQRSLRMIELHEKICKYSRPYKVMPAKQEYIAYLQREPVGLRNNQNSCFMNTALQCLVACEPLTQFFLENEHLKNINLGNHFGTFGEITTRYVEFLREYFTTKKAVIDTEKLKRALCRWDNKYLHDQQQDSQQFLIQLLDWLKEDLNINRTRPQYIETQDNQYYHAQKKAQKSWKTQLARHNSIIEYLMAGVLKSQIQCTQCSYKSQNFQNFLTLPLPVVKSKSIQKWTFDIKVSIVYQNFRKKNETAIIKLQSFRYRDAIKQIKSTFGLNKDSQLIGIVYQTLTFQNVRIQNQIQGRQQLIKSKQNPQQKLFLFYEHKKEQLNPEKFIEIKFSIKLRQNQHIIDISCPRYLFLPKREESNIIYVYGRLLSYFYSMMFKSKNLMNEREFIEKYLQPQNVPFKIYLSKENLQVLISSSLSPKHKAQIYVIFENQQLFNCSQLAKSIFIKKPNKLQQNFQKDLNNKMTIYDSLKQFESTDIMDFDNCWNCPKCKQKRKALKRISIYKAPKVLILFFKRFASTGEDYSHQMRKLQNFVSFPLTLDLQGYVQKQELPYTSEKRPLKYKLFAVANHYSLSSSHGESGHYTAFVNKQGQWFYVNDQKYGPISKEDISSKNAYMLFYMRI